MTVEGYTVMHDRDGAPEQAIAACLLADGRRAWGTSTDAAATALCDGEWVGRTVDLVSGRRPAPLSDAAREPWPIGQIASPIVSEAIAGQCSAA